VCRQRSVGKLKQFEKVMMIAPVSLLSKRSARLHTTFQGLALFWNLEIVLPGTAAE